MNVSLQDRPHYSSMLIGFTVGIISSIISTLIIFSSQFDWIGLMGDFLPILIPPVFLAGLAYALSSRYPSIWEDIKRRILVICMSLVGHSLGWYLVAAPAIISKKEHMFSNYLLAPLSIFAGGLIFGPAGTLFVQYFGVLIMLITLILSYYITKGLEVKRRILVILLLIFLVSWPAGLILFRWAD